MLRLIRQWNRSRYYINNNSVIGCRIWENLFEHLGKEEHQHGYEDGDSDWQLRGFAGLVGGKSNSG
jgi:hypothetical protein